MELSSQFPYYGPLNSGNYNVSLAIPGGLSKISKYYGITSSSSTGVMLPNTDFLKEFANGNLGISDTFLKNMIFKNINNPISSTNEDVFKQFAKLQKIDISDISKYKKGNKLFMPKESITISPEFEMSGFKAFEKTVFQSIFETQKPFMEIVKIAIESIAKSEDVIARAATLLAFNPISAKSRKPVGNSGSGDSRPKAIGYKSASELKSKLREYESIRTKIDDNIIKVDDGGLDLIMDIKNNINQSTVFNKNWKILSTVYSTGIFYPNIEYNYNYINLPPDPDYPEVDPIDLSTEDPYDKYKPKSIIFGIYNSKGESIDPNSTLKTIGLIGNNKIEINTPFKCADWLLNSPKWVFPEGVKEWPSFGTPNYVWKKTNTLFTGPNTIISKETPKDAKLLLGSYVISRYIEGQKNILTGLPAISGDPIIHSFDNIEYDTYNSYYNDLIDLAINKTTLSTIEKDEITNDIKKRLEIKNQVEFTFNYGHLKSSIYKKDGNGNTFPIFMKKSYLPYFLYRPESENDQDIIDLNSKKGFDKKGYIWIDPEADYDMKVIRIDPVSSIEYLEAQNKGELKTKINSFIKNKITFTSDNLFSISIKKNTEDIQIYDNTLSYSIENWNYEEGNIKNLNNFKVSIWSEIEPKKFSNKNFYNWSIANPKKFATASQTYTNYTINKMDNGKWYSNNLLSNGINKLGDNTYVMINNNYITRWYYLLDKDFNSSNDDIFNMPNFGIDKIINLNYETGQFEITDKTIPLYKIKIDNGNQNYKIIDPSQITNSFLSTSDLFIKDPEFYGHGDDDDPQTLGRINRYSLTDLDTESYYIVEGILKSENEFQTDDNGKRLNSGRGSGGDGWYRLPHALGAVSSFIRLIIDISVKMIPKIVKLINLFQNPFKYVSDIIADKLSRNFEFLSPEAIRIFKEANNIKNKTDIIGDITSVKNQIDLLRSNSRDKIKKILNNANNKSDIEQRQASIIAKDIQDKTELQISELENILNKKKVLANKLKEFYKNSILSNYVFLDEKSLESIFVLSGGSTIPFNLFGADLSFGLASEMNNVPKPIVKLIFPNSINKFKNIHYLTEIDNRPLNIDISINDEKNKLLEPNKNFDKEISNNFFVKKQMTGITFDSIINISFEDGTNKKITESELQDFVYSNKNKYNFIYITEELNKSLIEVDNLIISGTQEDLDKAKAILDTEKLKFPNNSIIDDKIKEIDIKNKNLAKNVQPLLKAILGFVTFPINVIADILKWMFNFFKSLTNPFTLASKMKEFLSFQWITEFVNSTSILDIFGLKFNPENLNNSSGKEGDLSQYISIGFIPKLPLYGKEQFKDLKDQPLRLLPMLKMLGKIINSVIDFIWSLFGIEAIVEVPHMSIVSDNISPEEILSIVNGIKPNEINTDNIIPENNYGDIQSFIYEVKMLDGSVKTFLNRIELNNFIEENKDINFDINF